MKNFNKITDVLKNMVLFCYLAYGFIYREFSADDPGMFAMLIIFLKIADIIIMKQCTAKNLVILIFAFTISLVVSLFINAQFIFAISYFKIPFIIYSCLIAVSVIAKKKYANEICP